MARLLAHLSRRTAAFRSYSGVLHWQQQASVHPRHSPRGGDEFLQRPFAHLDFERLEEVAGLDVDEVLRERHAAFEARAHFGDVVLEAAQRGDLALVDDDIVAGDTRLERLADNALGDEQTRRLAVLARREDVADFGAADDRLERLGPELPAMPARISSVSS